MDRLDQRMMNTPDLNKERLAKLKALFPDLFTVEGKLNPDELKKIIDPELVKETERFEFKWFGKSEAKRTAFTPSKATLAYDEKRSVNPEFADGNMIIEGENLETLKVLLAGYREKVKCIYIDPPYNTGKDFVYSDKWDVDKENYWEHIGVMNGGVQVDTNTETGGRYHSNWLNMLYPRLLLARQLLHNEGVIFVSIDDNEVYHLRKMCDEVFGEDNFISEIIWEKKFSPQNDAKWFSDNHDYLLVYAKSKELWHPILLKRNGSNNRFTNPDNDPRGVWASSDLTVKTYNEKYDYPITTPSGQFVMPTKGRCWSMPEESVQSLIKDNRIWFGKDGTNVPRIKTFLSEVSEGIVPLTIWKHVEVGHNQEARQEFKSLFQDDAVFDGPKPVRLLKRIFELSTSNDEEHIIVDFFSGSGTTAHAIMELNREDNGNRKFILVQIPELTDEKSEAYKSGYKKISDITIERNKRAIENIEKEETEKNPDLFTQDQKPFKTGFKVYKLAKSNFPRVEFTPDSTKTEEENLALLDKYIQEKEAMYLAMIDEKNIFDEVLLKNGFMLNFALEQIGSFVNNKVFLAKDDYKECLICMEMSIEKETLKELENHKDKIFICLERSLDTTMKWNLKHLLGEKLIAF